jgi:hypothetical protein
VLSIWGGRNGVPRKALRRVSLRRMVHAAIRGGNVPDVSAPRGRATYADLLEVPENLVAEINDGELITSPRPASPRALATSALGSAIFDRFNGRRAAPGRQGWWILDEPELHFGDDVAGWRREPTTGDRLAGGPRPCISRLRARPPKRRFSSGWKAPRSGLLALDGEAVRNRRRRRHARASPRGTRSTRPRLRAPPWKPGRGARTARATWTSACRFEGDGSGGPRSGRGSRRQTDPMYCINVW